MNEIDLHDVMDRATDAIEPRGDVTLRALAHARRRRSARRAAAASVSAVILIVAVALIVDGAGLRKGTPPPSAPSPATDVVTARWDPRDVEDLPKAAPHLAPAIPEVIEPPDESLLLTGSPVQSAVLVVAMDSTAHLLSDTGAWRRVPLPGRFPGVALSPEGTRLAVIDEDDSIEIYDIASGQRHSVDPPRDAVGWDFSSWTWVDEESLLYTDAEGGWRVEARDGEAQRVPFPRLTLSWSFDPEGHVVESADWTEPAVMTDWASGEPRRVSMAATGRLSFIKADAETVVGTSYENGPFAVYVADRSTLTPRAILRTRDHEANYSNGGLSVVALLDDGSVLLRVAVFGPEDGFRIVAWEPDTGDLAVVSASSQPLPANVVFAQALIRRSDP